MSYASLGYYALLFVVVILYYVIPPKQRWIVLLVGSGLFYILATKDILVIAVFLGTGIISYIGGISLEMKRRRRHRNKAWLWLFCLASAAPLLLSKTAAVLRLGTVFNSLVIPLGVSFYSLQMVAYLVDIYRGKIDAQRNVLKYLLYISFFPIIIQGPISRYRQLYEEVTTGHLFDESKFVKGLQSVGGGLFLKMMIADRLAIIVSSIFDQYPKYLLGSYALLGGILFTVQLYLDFLSCYMISCGSAGLFGIRLPKNFNHPYLATSISDFWRRWHMSLSSWLRDYVYIPLGGNRKGKFRKDINILITFLLSGLWHCNSQNAFHFIVWGLMHAIYQIVGARTRSLQRMAYDILDMKNMSFARLFVRRIFTCFFVVIAFIMFRAETTLAGIQMIVSIFTVWNPWVWSDGSLLQLGLDWPDIIVLAMSLTVAIKVFRIAEKIDIGEWILSQHIWIRWNIYLAVIVAIWIFGVYGYEFEASAFIYGGF